MITLLTTLIVVILLNFLIFSVHVQPKKDRLESIKNQIQIKQSDLSKKNDSLQNNISILEEIKSKNANKLYNPSYEEATSFLNNTTYTATNEIINNAKNQSIRCALIILRIQENGTIYELIAFNTSNYGMNYFEPATNYRIIPEVGLSYTECFVNHNYLPNYLIDDTITEILTIW